MIKRVLYIGGDEDFLSELESRTVDHDIEVYAGGAAPHVQPGWLHLYLILLDCDELADPALQLQQLREWHPNAAIIMLDQVRRMPLTQVSLAMMHGAESFHWKPIEDWVHLVSALQGAFDRMGRWHRLMDEFETPAEHVEPPAFTEFAV